MTNPKDLTQLNSNDFRTFIDSFDYILSDCDGVIWTPRPNPEAGKFINLIKELGKKVHFVSNNSLRTKENFLAQFQATNIENGYENLTIPSTAIGEYLKSLNFNKTIYCVACPETVKMLEFYGFTVKTGPETCPEIYTDFDQFLDDDQEIGAVVLDCDFHINLAKIHKAVTYLRRDEVLFIHGATDRHCSMRSGTLSLAPGAFKDLVAEEVNRSPLLLAKPGKMFADFAMKRAGVSPDEACMVLFIGDMIEQDIGLGKVAGFQTLLVLTNTTVDKMLAHEIQPDYYAPSLASLVPQVETFMKK